MTDRTTSRNARANRRKGREGSERAIGSPASVLLVALILLLGGCAVGEYRMPYKDGTYIDVFRDHLTHSSPVAKMYDLEAENMLPAEIVAAAPGWVRFIDDDHEELADKSINTLNNYVWIEHPYPYCPVDPNRSNWPGKPSNYESTCIECEEEFCNEWTTYAHMTKQSVRVDAGLTEGDWVEAGDFLGYEDEVGDAYGVHLHWHVAVIPPDTLPTFNGYYLDYVDDTGVQPELVPVVCHAGGASVLWRTGFYTAAPCPAAAQAPAQTFLRGQLATGSPLAAILRHIAGITDEAVELAMGDPGLLLQTRKVFQRLEPAFRNLMELNRASISQAELKMLMELFEEYETRGSAQLRRKLTPIRQRLEDPGQRASLGIKVQPAVSLD